MLDQTSTPTRLISHRGGVPVYQYRTDPHTPPLSVIRRPEQVRNQGRHIHDFPALWYRPAVGAVYVVAAGEVLDPEVLGDLEGGDLTIPQSPGKANGGLEEKRVTHWASEGQERRGRR